jgi:hypothetical protein
MASFGNSAAEPSGSNSREHFISEMDRTEVHSEGVRWTELAQLVSNIVISGVETSGSATTKLIPSLYKFCSNS